MAISSRGRHLVSASEDGLTIVYDYAKQEVEREMEIQGANVGVPNDMIVMEDERTLVVADNTGLHPIDITSTSRSERCFD